jgi:hypothetical protein
LQEEISVLAKLHGRMEFRSEGFDVFDLAFCDGGEDVAGPLFD